MNNDDVYYYYDQFCCRVLDENVWSSALDVLPRVSPCSVILVLEVPEQDITFRQAGITEDRSKGQLSIGVFENALEKAMLCGPNGKASQSVHRIQIASYTT